MTRRGGMFVAVRARRQGLTIESDGRVMSISNGPLLVRLTLRDGGYAQEFCALDSKGEYRLVLSSIHKELIPFSEHRACASPMIAGARQHLFAVCRESLRMVFSDVRLRRPSRDRVIVELRGSVQGHKLLMQLAIEAGSKVIHVTVEDTPPDTAIEYLMSSYAFLPDGRILEMDDESPFTWAPCTRPASDAVIGDMAFFSPAAIVQRDRFAAALIPDLDMLKQHRPMPTALDLDLTNGLLFAPLLSFGFCDYEPAGGSFRHDVTHSRRLDTNRLTYGFDLIIDADCKRDSARGQVARFLWNRYAGSTRGVFVRTDLREVTRQVRAMRESVLSAPADRGPFPTRFNEATGCWRGCRFGPESACYSTVECSEQLHRLLQLQACAEPVEAILALARSYADFLIESRAKSGAIPCWFAEDLTVVSTLRSGAPTAASALFLAELAKITRERKYLAACEQSARFVLREIVPNGLYLDHTCADMPVDPHTGMRPQSTRAMLWVAQLCLQLHSIFGDRSYLLQGLDVLDLMCLAQSVGEKPWMGGGSGLLSRGNSTPVPDPELSADFALCALRYGAVTGTAEYSERGAAALNAALAAHCDDLTAARIAAIAAIAHREFPSLCSMPTPARRPSTGSGCSGRPARRLRKRAVRRSTLPVSRASGG